MPGKANLVPWTCPQCTRTYWLKPGRARKKKFCSRPCQYAGHRVEHPVRLIPSKKKTYGQRACEYCHTLYEAKTKFQQFCSQKCSYAHTCEQNKQVVIEPRPCENCGRMFQPRRGGAGRFCSKPCSNTGQSGEKAAHWKGGRHVTSEGYVKIVQPGHPKSHGNGDYVAEHTIVMEHMIGRYLYDNEEVHHKNGVRSDNVPNNLELWAKSQPPGQRVEDLLAYAEALVKLYKPIVAKLRAVKEVDSRQLTLLEDSA